MLCIVCYCNSTYKIMCPVIKTADELMVSGHYVYYQNFHPVFFYIPMFFVRFFCKCWWPISVRAYACVRIGQSVKLGLVWSHDITGLRGLLASQQLLLLLFLSPHKLLHSVSFRYQALSPSFYLLH